MSSEVDANNAEPETGFTALHWAAAGGQPEVVAGQGQSLSLELDPVTYPPAPSQAPSDPPQPPSVIDANGPRITLLNLDPSTPIDTSKYALVCDVRSPDEYEEDRIFSAISTPVLSNGQRCTVGTLFKQSPFEAKKLGAALVATNLGAIINEHFLASPKNMKVLVYCWRGGERSYSLAHTLCRIGFDVSLVSGGYRAYRNQVLATLADAGRFQFHIISGKTGCGKGVLLDELRAQGAQVIDLEGCASHRGSILGQDPECSFMQPSQKLFESRVYDEICRFDPSRPVFVEGEGSRVGVRNVPSKVWKGMKAAKHTVVEASTDERVRYLLAGYEHFTTTHVDMLKEKLRMLTRKRGKAMTDRWCASVDAGNFAEFVEDILLNHYDPGYIAASKRDYSDAWGVDKQSGDDDASDDGNETGTDVKFPRETNVRWVSEISKAAYREVATEIIQRVVL